MEKDDFSKWQNKKNNLFIINDLSEKETLDIIMETTKKVLHFLKSNKNKATINSEFHQNRITSDLSIWEFPLKGDRECISKSIDTILWDSKVPNFSSPNYFWHMLPPTTIYSLASSNIANILNQNVIAQEVSPAFTQMENVVVSYLSDLIWYDINEAWWSIVSWWTTANHTALLVARNKILPWVTELWMEWSLKKYNQENDTNYKKTVMLYWEDSHYSIEKLWWYIWIWTDNMLKIPYIQWTHKIDLEKLKTMIDECEKKGMLIASIIITAWTTEKWHVQDIKWVNEIAKIWQNNRPIHLHVDAAHWWWYLVNDELKETVFKWIEEADSVTIDWHKMLYTNYSCWGIVFKDKNSMEYIKHSAGYVIPTDSDDDNHWANTIEWSRWASWIFQLYANLHWIWKEWYKKLINKSLENKEYLLKKLKKEQNKYEILSPGAELNLVCFRYKNEWKNEAELNEINNQLKKELDDDWTYFVSTTTIDDKKTLRLAFMNPKTWEENIDGFLDKVTDILKKITN